jgi:putative cardiolipin synthase
VEPAHRHTVTTRRKRLLIGAALVCVVTGLLGSCARLPPRPDLPQQLAIGPAAGGVLDQLIAPHEATHSNQSAFRLIHEGTEAFASRLQATRLASRSVDIQSYIWHADLTGMYFAQELLRAADRGVRVRVLLDDMDARQGNDAIAALATHPGVEVRMFNPFASRHGLLGMVGEGVRSFSRINRRMHNKSWIADNRIAIVGGRNVGDEYFGASDAVNFVDLDFAMIGAVVRDASASFDRYWNSASAYPMEALTAASVSGDALRRVRAFLDAHAAAAENTRYAARLRADETVRRLFDGDWPMQWASSYRFVADDPAKVLLKERDTRATRVGAALLPIVEGSHQRLAVISPYFVPGREVTQLLTGLAAGGRQVQVLTNSLAANDVAAVHGGYSRYRRPLLDGGVQLWELKPLGGDRVDSSPLGSSGASLHTKAVAVDGRVLFVGSFNLDPRSIWMNCEQGVVVESEALARQLEQIFTQQTSGPHAWRVEVRADELRWSDDRAEFDSDPRAPTSRRFQAWLARVLHLDAQL